MTDSDGHRIPLPDKPQRLSVEDAESLFSQILRVCQRRILALTYGITTDLHASQDITQEAFLKLYNHLHKKKIDRHLIGWLRRVATNAALMHVRKNNHNPIVPFSDAHIGGIPAATREETEACRRLAEALGKLPTRKREILEMRVLDEMSYEEIAQVMGGSPGSVQASFRRTRDKIARKLGE